PMQQHAPGFAIAIPGFCQHIETSGKPLLRLFGIRNIAPDEAAIRHPVSWWEFRSNFLGLRLALLHFWAERIGDKCPCYVSVHTDGSRNFGKATDGDILVDPSFQNER